MKDLRSYFKLTRSQQSGILFLLLIIIILQCIYFFGIPTTISISSNEDAFDSDKLEVFQEEVDSLRLIEIENSKPKLFPFNPNYITDHKGYTLGMSLEEIDRLHKYREQNKWVNSSKEFQQITKVSDSLLNQISQYFKFPEWVTRPKPKTYTNSYSNYNTPKTYAQKTDLNKATAKQLQRVNGIGEKLSDRIIKFRNKFIGGFIADVQLHDVYGLTPEVIERVTQQFTVKTPRVIKKLNINTATTEDLVTIQHIDYDIAYALVEQRTLREGYSSFIELTKVKGFPVEKIEIIKLYLTLD